MWVLVLAGIKSPDGLFQNGQSSNRVQWIGASLHAEYDEVIVAVKPETLDELTVQVRELRAGPNLVKESCLRALAGRGNFVAGVVPTWRFFLQQLYAAI